MKNLTTTLCLTIAVLLGSAGVSGNVFAQTVDFAVKITDYSAFADKKIKITDYSALADKTVCITNPRGLDEETLRVLGLID